MKLKILCFPSIINEKTKKRSLLIGVVFTASTGIFLLHLYWLIYLTVSR